MVIRSFITFSYSGRLLKHPAPLTRIVSYANGGCPNLPWVYAVRDVVGDEAIEPTPFASDLDGVEHVTASQRRRS